MCDDHSTSSDSSASASGDPDRAESPHRSFGSPISRRSILGAALAGTGAAVAGSVLGSMATGTPAAQAATDAQGAALPALLGNQFRPVLPVNSNQPKGTVLTQLGTSGGPQAEYVRTGTSTVLTVDGFNYVVDAGRSSVTQYLNAGLQFGVMAGMFITHLHADHLADYYNYFLLETGQPNAEGDMLPYPPPKAGQPLPVRGPGPAGALPPAPSPDTPTISPADPTPGIKTLTDRMTEAFAYSWNVFLRGDGYNPITEFTSDVKEIVVPASAGASPTNTAPPGMEPFKIFEDCRVSVSAILVPHGEVFPAFAYRFDTDHGSVVFSGDTSCPGYTASTNNVIKLAEGADILVHEVMNWDVIVANALLHGKNPNTDPLLQHLKKSHTRADQVGKVAQAAGVPQLVLTHLIPSNPRDVPDFVWKAVCSIGYSGNVHVGNDFDQIPLPIKR